MNNNILNPKATVATWRQRPKVSYFYRYDTASHHYGTNHPMKPHRLRLTHHLVLSMGLYRQMEVYRPHRASAEEMEKFHLHDYVNFLRRVSPLTEEEFERQAARFALGSGSDCPIFEGLYEFMSVCAGGSVDAAMQINHGGQVCVNWAGGLHHAKKAEASGFCYINDIVLCILELLKYHARVLYVDIDIHHGDGVEEAFYTTNRVMTCSFHQYGDFFPGTGAVTDIGHGAGKYCSVNVPLSAGLDDVSFEWVFKPVLDKIMAVYAPSAVVMCCGADSIVGDRIGVWNMSLHGHSMAVDYVKSFGIPLVLLGGGGYRPSNVSRCWAYETAVAVGNHVELRDAIPMNEFYTSFGPSYRLHLDPDPMMENKNTRAQLENLLETVLTNLGELKGPPSVPLQDVPPDFFTQPPHARAKRRREEASELEGEEERENAEDEAEAEERRRSEAAAARAKRLENRRMLVELANNTGAAEEEEAEEAAGVSTQSNHARRRGGRSASADPAPVTAGDDNDNSKIDTSSTKCGGYFGDGGDDDGYVGIGKVDATTRAEEVDAENTSNSQ